jgi:glycerol dehydrogenase-like iron-containing ADH family enzyme
VGKTTPDPLIIDFDLIPRDLDIAGVGDILSIHTATYDWELAHKAVKSEYPFSPDDIDKARFILAEVMSYSCSQRCRRREPC